MSHKLFSIENFRLISVILIALSLIFLGGALFYMHNTPKPHLRNPVLWALAIALASGGGNILIGIIYKIILPIQISDKIRELKYFEI
tara:strand:- start:303 stop:563 length:261 start_codon:yes stop_codon:yes gene_type:complete